MEREGRLPDAVLACVGGGSNAIGIFTAFVPDDGVRLIGLEAGGDGVETGRHAATITGGSPGVLHGARSYLLQDDNGQTIERSEEHTYELQSRQYLVCRLLLEKKKT